MGFAHIAEDMKRTVESVDTRLEKVAAPLRSDIVNLNKQVTGNKGDIRRLTEAQERTASDLAEVSEMVLVLAELAGMQVTAETKSVGRK